MQRVEAKLVGLTPLLISAFGSGNEIDLPGAAGRPGTRTVALKEELTPRQAAEKAVYRNKQGQFFFPSTCILRLCREVASMHKIKGTRRSAKYLVPAALYLPVEEYIICNGDGKPAKDYEVDSRPVVIPATKGRVMRHRPRWDQWSVTVVLDVDDEIMEPAFVHKLLEEGGRRNGLGDFRPEKGGPFGRYRVVHFQES